jgi:putative addiction module killer protein
MKLAYFSEREFIRWYRRLGPQQQAKVESELEALIATGPAVGMPVVRDLGHGLFELRIRIGQQPRLYFRSDDDTIELLTYGRKDTQQRDIDRARRRMT